MTRRFGFGSDAASAASGLHPGPAALDMVNQRLHRSSRGANWGWPSRRLLVISLELQRSPGR